MKEKNYKFIKMGSMILSFVMLLTACAPVAETPETSTSSTKEEKPYQSSLNLISPQAYNDISGLALAPGSYISIIGNRLGSPFWDEIQEGAKQAVADLNSALGYTGSDAIRLTYSGPSKKDNVDEQINILDEELSRYPTAIGMAILDAQACEVQFDLAAENGIPVIAFDSENNKDIEAMVSTNNQDSTYTAVSKLSSLLGNSGRVIMISRDSKSSSLAERLQYAKEYFEVHSPDVEVVEILSLDNLSEQKEIIATSYNETVEDELDYITSEDISDENVLAYYLEYYEGVNGFFATDDDSSQYLISVLDEQEANYEELSIVSYDTSSAQIAALEAKKLDGIILQNPFGMGYATVIACVRSALELGNEAFIDTGYAWMTLENLEKESIQSILY